jgi:hypothetical protein
MEKVTRAGLQEVYTASTATTALPVDGSSPVPQTARPTGTDGSAAKECREWPTMRFVFGGTDAADETVNYRIIGWTKGDDVWHPQVLASGVFTLGAMAMTVVSLDTAATLLADTITDTIGLAGTIVRSPGLNTVADIVVRTSAADLITVETDLGTAASASVYSQAVSDIGSAADSLLRDLLTAIGGGGSETEKTHVKIVKTVTSSGTAEPLVATQTFALAYHLQGKLVAGDNTGNVFAGLSDLAAGSAELFEVAPGETFDEAMPSGTKVDLNNIYVDADNNGDGVVGWYIPA